MRLTDHQVCGAVRWGKDIRDMHGILRCAERGLLDLHPALTVKGIALLDGIEPTSASGAHMGGAPPVGDWRAVRRDRRSGT